MRIAEDLTGDKFGFLIVVKRAPNSKYGTPKWLCKCKCGKRTIILGSALRSNRTKSCGCLRKIKTAERFYVHGRYSSLLEGKIKDSELKQYR